MKEIWGPSQLRRVKMRELTKKELERQDFVDNSIFELIAKLNPTYSELTWDIEMIGEIRDDILKWLELKTKTLKEYDFYPYLENE